jgi:hypothetical protein
MTITDDNADVNWGMSLKDFMKDVVTDTILDGLNQAKIAEGII